MFEDYEGGESDSDDSGDESYSDLSQAWSSDDDAETMMAKMAAQV